MNKGIVIGLILILGVAVLSMGLFKSTMVNYVSFAEAKGAVDYSVQIMGAPVDGTMDYDKYDKALEFKMRDTTGSIMPVRFKGPKPEDLNFAMRKATQITAQGSYNRVDRVFDADNLLVKCPSKYQGKDGSERRYGNKPNS